MAERSADILIKPARVKSPSRISASENKFPIRIVKEKGYKREKLGLEVFLRS